jgi:hypothetical protein
MLLSFNSNTRVDTSGAGTDYYFISPAFIHSFYCHQRCPISSFLCNVLLINVCLFVRFLLVIVLSDYLFGIFKHFLQSLYCLTTYLVSSNISCRYCPLDLCLLAIALSVRLRFTGSDYTVKLFLQTNRDLLYRCLQLCSFLRYK